MDTVFIERLEIEALIGVHHFERARPRPLLVDLELGIDSRRAAASDAVADTIDYDAVCSRIATLAIATRFALVETLAERLAEMLMREFGTPWLRLRIAKPGAVPAARAAGVLIERGRRD
jgi:dihydroneopterin aldolase